MMSNPTTPFGNTSSEFTQSIDVQVSWDKIMFKAGDRVILKNLTGNALSRRSLAIMGSSGAGKTTFLNALSDRLDSDGKNTFLEGKRYMNDVEYDRKFRTMVGYVTQEDVLDPMSNPEEILSFSLRTRRGTTPEETQERVDKMLHELGLEKARETIVGIPGVVTGLSGGERKRANIGSELITNPKVLYLDEPTSGLDSVTASRICHLMKKLANRGRTVIYTIHQPTEECTQYFDDLMLMCKGQIVYHGPYTDAVGYFAEIGYDCPETYTPTDFFMTLLQDEQIGDILIEKWTEFLDKVDPMEYAYVKPMAPSNESFTERYLTTYAAGAKGSMAIEFVELMKRSINAVARNKLFSAALVIQNVFFALVVGLLFAKLEDDVTGVSDRMGLLFIIVANLAFSGVMGVLNTFPPKKAVFIREQQSGAYSPTLYFITMQLAELPVQLAALFLQAVIIYWIAGLAPTAAAFFTFYAAMSMVYLVGAGFGYLIGTAVDSYVVASALAPLCVIPLMLCAGLLASTDRLRPYWYWLEKPSFLRSGFLIMVQNEFEDLHHIRCDVEKFGTGFCLRQPANGNEVLTQYEFNDDHSKEWIQWMILGIMFVVLRLITVGCLYLVAKRKS